MFNHDNQSTTIKNNLINQLILPKYPSAIYHMGETVWYLGRVALRLRTAQEYRYNLKLIIYFTFKTYFFNIIYN